MAHRRRSPWSLSRRKALIVMGQVHMGDGIAVDDGPGTSAGAGGSATREILARQEGTSLGAGNGSRTLGRHVCVAAAALTQAQRSSLGGKSSRVSARVRHGVVGTRDT